MRINGMPVPPSDLAPVGGKEGKGAHGAAMEFEVGDEIQAEVSVSDDGRLTLKTADGSILNARSERPLALFAGEILRLVVTGKKDGVLLVTLGEENATPHEVLRRLGEPATPRHLQMATEILKSSLPPSPAVWEKLAHALQYFQELTPDQAVFMLEHHVPINKQNIQLLGRMSGEEYKLGQMLARLVDLLVQEAPSGATTETVAPGAAALGGGMPGIDAAPGTTVEVRAAVSDAAETRAATPGTVATPGEATPGTADVRAATTPGATAPETVTTPETITADTRAAADTRTAAPGDVADVRATTPGAATTDTAAAAPGAAADVRAATTGATDNRVTVPETGVPGPAAPGAAAVRTAAPEAAPTTAATPGAVADVRAAVPGDVADVRATTPGAADVRAAVPGAATDNRAAGLGTAPGTATATTDTAAARPGAAANRTAAPAPQAMEALRVKISDLFLRIRPDHGLAPEEINADKLHRELAETLRAIAGQAETLPAERRDAILSLLKDIASDARFSPLLDRFATVVQWPLSVGGHKAEGELYVFRDKNKKTRIDPRNATLFLSLTTARLGCVEVFVRVIGNQVECDFKLAEKEGVVATQGQADTLRGLLESQGYRLARSSFAKKEKPAANLPEIRLQRDDFDKRYTFEAKA
ncbi:MAG: flagellar hook-length control protein FliK [Oscillospiraceae bacterium]|nr:flagellar hook-length control protein FliK [Oscillospiraceae bacterium]